MPSNTTTDPLGRRITLHDHTWFGHIAVRHPEMRRHRRLIDPAIANPIEIRLSTADADCRLYFGRGPRKGTMLLVVADVVRGFVKTAHIVREAKGALEWSRPTQ
jgi:hypothetical protein